MYFCDISPSAPSEVRVIKSFPSLGSEMWSIMSEYDITG